jgi:hypothetical protein
LKKIWNFNKNFKPTSKFLKKHYKSIKQNMNSNCFYSTKLKKLLCILNFIDLEINATR